jgi:hypothetical protein
MRVYRIYAERNQQKSNDIDLLMGNKSLQDSLLVLKEVNALLATEAMLRELKCHVLIYVSDPVIIAEQIFSRDGLGTSYLDLECIAVMESAFLKRFLTNEIRTVLRAFKLIKRMTSRRQRSVQMKIITIALIQHMFRMLAARYPELATVVDYTIIQNDPRRLEYPLVNWLGPDNMDRTKCVIDKATFTPNGHESDRWKRSWPETITTFEVLNTEDVARAYKLVIDLGLMRDEGFSKVWTERSAV